VNAPPPAQRIEENVMLWVSSFFKFAPIALSMLKEILGMFRGFGNNYNNRPQTAESLADMVQDFSRRFNSDKMQDALRAQGLEGKVTGKLDMVREFDDVINLFKALRDKPGVSAEDRSEFNSIISTLERGRAQVQAMGPNNGRYDVLLGGRSVPEVTAEIRTRNGLVPPTGVEVRRPAP
jgi:hypothetical protein